MNIKAEIDIDFMHAMEQADKIDELSGLLCGVVNNQIDDAFMLIGNSWKGENARDYLKRTKGIKKRMYESAEILKNTAELIRGTAKLIYAAEMAAIQIVTN